MHMLHCSKPPRKSPEGLRIDGEYVHPLYVYMLYHICIDENPGVVSEGRGYRVSYKCSVEGVTGKISLMWVGECAIKYPNSKGHPTRELEGLSGTPPRPHIF